MKRQERKTIIISEDTQRLLMEEMEMTEYKFRGSIKRFLHDLLQDPITAEPGNILALNGLTRAKLLKILIKKGILEKHMKIVDKNADGEPMTAKMKVSFKVPKQEYDKKIKRLYIELFEKNIPPKKKDINEGIEIFTPNQIDRLIGNNRSDQIAQKEDGYNESLNETESNILVYHGTPHKFIEFSTKNIGGGEGNQSFGWGLYFTSNKDIAEFYAKTYAKEGVGYVYTVKLNVKNLFPWYDSIPNEIKKKVIEALRNNGVDELPLKYMLENGEVVPKLASIEEAIDYYPNGKFLYENLKYVTETDKETSLFLHKLGFDGIRYDANSFRNDGRGGVYGENYVIFSEDNVKVVDIEKIRTTVEECTAGGAGCDMGGCSGEGTGATTSSGVYSDNPSGVGFLTPIAGVQRRTIYGVEPKKKKKKEDVDEATTTTNTGDYQYTVPFPVDSDDPTMKRHKGVGGSESINIAENK